jgi:hypothetical protein
MNTHLATHRIIARKNIWPVINLIALPMLFLSGSLAYLQTEARTNVFSDDFGDLTAICNEYTGETKFFKINHYNRSRGYARVQCIGYSTDQNREIELVQRAEDEPWEVVVVDRLNEKQTLYWPVYK